ncbi:MAG TPA: DUF4062 domain-containing protein [Candidatus Paceibacterota bacterium]|nr:DUF4062 domain-containing protein [Candidatus Paceibacterota bacterium]
MADQIIKVFISSTLKDFEEERKAVKDAIDELNPTMDLYGIALIAIDLKTGARPNPSKDECLETVAKSHVLIGLLGLRYGQIEPDTGKSITELEYDKAQELDLPTLMYVRHEHVRIDQSWMDTNLDRIAKRKAFREKVEENQKRDTFKTSAQLRGHVLRDLAHIVLEKCAPQTQGQTIEPVEKTRDVQPADGATEPVAPGAPPKKATEVRQLLQSIIDNIADEEKIDSHQRRRLYLLAASMFYKTEASGVLGTHEIQLLYSDRRSFVPIVREVSYLARAIFSDQYNVKAGWFWLKSFPSKPLIEDLRWRSINERHEDTRTGYLSLLKEFWSSTTEEILCENAAYKSKSVALGALRILQDFGTVNSIEAIRALEKVEDDDIKKASRRTQFAILGRDNAPRAVGMFKECEGSEAAGVEYELAEVLKKLGVAALAKLQKGENEQLQKLATTELARREELSDEELYELTSTEDPYARYLAYTSLINKGHTFKPEEIEKNWELHSPPTFLSGLSGFLGRTHWRDEIILRVFAAYSLDDLEGRIGWIGTTVHLAYLAWGLKGTEKVLGQVRKDLQNSFERIRKSAIEKLDKALAWGRGQQAPAKLRAILASLDEMRANAAAGEGYIVDQFNESALKILLEQPKPDDLPVAKKFMRSERADIAHLATEIFLKLATKSDMVGLIDVALKKSGKLQEEAAAKALAFDEKGLAFEKFLGSENDALVRTCLKTSLSDGVCLDSGRIHSLLHSKKDQIREMAAAYIMEAFNRDKKKLERFLNDYVQSETYYYNVVCWLDRILYAPRIFKMMFRKQLAEKLK